MLEGRIATADADALELMLSSSARMSSPCPRATRAIIRMRMTPIAIKGQGHEDGQIVVAIQAGPGEAGGVGIDPEPAHLLQTITTYVPPALFYALFLFSFLDALRTILVRT